MTPLRNFVIYLYGHGVLLVHLRPGQALGHKSREPEQGSLMDYWRPHHPLSNAPLESVWTATPQ